MPNPGRAFLHVLIVVLIGTAMIVGAVLLIVHQVVQAVRALLGI